MHDEQQIIITKTEGAYSVVFTQQWVPQEVHQAQRAISMEYQRYRNKIYVAAGKSAILGKDLKDGSRKRKTK